MRGLFKQLKPESVGRKIFLLVWLMLIVCSLVHSVYNDFYYLNYREWASVSGSSTIMAVS
ncbi:MAG: hypothetical protein SPL43_08760 [Prevotella sp.]|nr:hypothetical protein [Prevotella sp.]